MHLGGELWHDVHGSFRELLPRALRGQNVGVGLGPIYQTDPAEQLMLPFVRSARESGWSFNEIFVPDWVSERAKKLRNEAVNAVVPMHDWVETNRWTRAGLVLEVASRWGVPYEGTRKYPRWKLNGTVTTRFGVESGTFNPMVVASADRSKVRPDDGYNIAVIDFVAMDLCSMVSLVPDMAEWYSDADDLHQRTADIMDISRDEAKIEIFTHAYGGRSHLREKFESRMPYLSEIRRMGEHGDGARRVQTQSARAFRGALSAALPYLVNDGVRPIFTVHDELTLECRVGSEGLAERVSDVLAEGASQTIRVTYRTGLRFGRTYLDAKPA